MIYNYTKDTVSSDRLEVEIRESAITIALDFITTDGQALSIHFKDNLPAEQVTILDGIVTAHTGEPLPHNDPAPVHVTDLQMTDLRGIPKVAMYEPEGDSATIVSHDFTDACSWYQESKEMTETLTREGETLVYAGTKPHWIDLMNGRLYDEDNILAQNPGKWRTTIKVDGVTVTSGFTLDPKLGKVTFEQEPTGVVSANYWYADKSYYTIRPRPGKTVLIKAAEVQFSNNVVIHSPFVFEAWVEVNGTLYPVPGSQIVYKNAKDFISACNEGQGLIPKWGGLQHDVHVFPFHYARNKAIKDVVKAMIRVYIKDHTPLVGEYATGTFYILSEPEDPPHET